MTDRHVLISGAGIAGPALAYWLRRAGWAATVVERAPAPRPGGQTVDLRGVGRTVTERMGLLDRVREVLVHEEGFALVDARGRVSARMPADSFGGEGIVAELEVLRGDLCRVLYEATLPDTEYIFDDTITAIEEDADGVTVTFEHAAPRRFALVVGADGLHSAVRRLAFGPDAEFIHRFDLYNGGFTTPAILDLDGWCLMHNEPGGMVALVRPGRLRDELKVGLSFRSGPLDLDRRDAAAQKEALASRFAGAGWEIPRLLEHMWDAPDFYFDSAGQVRAERWSKGRAVLLGDAGYCPTPLTGLGTSLALVGAYVLAGELQAARGDHRTAFTRYEERMRPYVAQAQEMPPGGIGMFAPRSAVMIRLRALSMAMMTRWPLRAMMERQVARADAIELPDYEMDAARDDAMVSPPPL